MMEEDYCHYFRTCLKCGKNWWGLHCPHELYQNPCGQCGLVPVTVVAPDCDCEFAVPVREILGIIKNIIGQPEHDETGKDIRIQTRNALREQQLKNLKEVL
jgi:hypothetical protein